MQRQLNLEVLVGEEERRQLLVRDTVEGLTRTQKRIPPVWFYDEVGSRLFDEITRLPEYYPTRCERSILERHSRDIAEVARADTLVEIGSGTSEKTHLLLEAMAAVGTLRRIVLVDISRDVLIEAARTLEKAYDVDVTAVVGDFRLHLQELPHDGRELWAFLGSTIGNLEPAERSDLLRDFRTSMGPDDLLLLGTDLVKDPRRLVEAYDDRDGVTAEFNKNVLLVLDRELHADFDPELFEHRALWNPEQRWIEMRLRARRAHTVTIKGIGLTVSFNRGEEILTEISAKFSPEGVVEELAGADLDAHAIYQDDNGDFQLTLARPRAGSL